MVTIDIPILSVVNAAPVAVIISAATVKLFMWLVSLGLQAWEALPWG